MVYNYKEALEWLYSQLPMFSRVGAAAYKPGLQTTEALDEAYGHPHRKFKSIHVAGTNGKGSTSHMLAAALRSQGYKTGLYTSPHLIDFRERMRIDGKMIPQDEVARFVAEWRNRKSPLSPSFFELTMMMAFDWFAREEVDYAVIEVGMGGRLDSTNVITPVLGVITNISFDHTQFLGNTRAAIASEKAGIIKPGIPVVIGEADAEVRPVFEEKAACEGAPIYFAEEFRGVESIEKCDGGFECRFADGRKAIVPLSGSYQRHNIRTAACALNLLEGLGVIRDRYKLMEGLENVCSLTGLRGRWEQLGQNPVVICDTGHNVAGLSENMATLAERFPGSHIRFVVGFVNDKDVSHIVDLFPADASYYFTRASIPRAMSAEDVAAHFASRGISGKVIPDVAEAYRTALGETSPTDVVYVGGSTFVVADLLANLELNQ